MYLVHLLRLLFFVVFYVLELKMIKELADLRSKYLTANIIVVCLKKMQVIK